MRRPDTARLGEQIAARHLEQGGCRVIERNYRTREGEIDLVALCGQTLVFCEVKTLVARSRASGPAHPLESVRPTKRAQVRRMARSWLGERVAGSGAPRCRDIRFDALGILLSPSGRLLQLDHIESAF